MGIDYAFNMVVGFKFSVASAIRPFLITSGGNRFHMEDRFDPKTGKKVGEEKVFDEKETRFLAFDDIKIDVDEAEEFLEKLSKKIGIKCDIYGSPMCGKPKTIFYPKSHPKYVGGWHALDKVSGSGHLSWEKVAEMGNDLDKLRMKLIQLGLKPGKAEIVLCRTDTYEL